MAYSLYTPPTEAKIAQANAITSKFFTKGVEQLVYEDSPTFSSLKDRKKVKVKGGTLMQWQVRVDKLGTSGAVDPRVAVTWETNDTIIGATLNKKFYHGKTLMQWDEIEQNQGTPELVSLIKEKTKELKEDIGDDLIGDAFATSQASTTDIVPFALWISNSTVAGIDPSTLDDSTRWKAGKVESQAALDLQMFVDASYTSLSGAINACTFGKQRPTIAVTTRDILTAIKAWAWTYRRLTTNDRMTKLGFDNVEFDGIPIVADPFCPSGYLYLIDEDAVELVVSPGYDFKMTPWKEHENYPNALFRGISWVGNTKFSRRHTSGIYTGIATVESA